MDEAFEANIGQAALWNDGAGSVWVEMQDLLDRLFAPVEARVIAAGFPGAGRRVVDIGCGAGATTLAMARRLGPSGSALGVDISRPLVDAAARRAAAAGLPSARFVAADAQTYAFGAPAFDAAISRFGVMFFDDPVAAFRNIGRALRRDGALAFAAWRGPDENPFMTAAARAARPLLPGLPATEADAPGQFGFARADRVRQVLGEAGWRGVDIRPFDVPASLEPRDLALYAAKMGPVGQALRALGDDARRPVAEAVRRSFDPFVRDGVARFSLACWLVTARAPGAPA